ncbi:MAG: adenylyltransferase/cytidyltransferase family protein [Planctomycetes bacterium]|nr:adenylyltransferase/cytidyltransferase family protein [Planctomycetota bacterium]
MIAGPFTELWRFRMPVTVFTNGCFDLLHPGHVDLLDRCRALGDRLIVGINSDASVQRLKGPHKPFICEDDRRWMLLALKSVDEVLVFDAPTPLELIEQVRPDVLVKGGDWSVDRIVGAEFVQSYGGRVLSLDLLPGHSSSTLAIEIARKVQQSQCPTGS